VHFLFNPANASFAAHFGKLIVLIGMDGSDLLVLDKDLAYSLNKERTTTKLFIMEYNKTTMGKLVEISLEELICRFAFTY
jgi:hypothetical protein